VAGLAFDYKRLRPRLSVGSGSTLRASTATVGSTAVMAYVKVVGRVATLKVEALQGANMTDHVMLGGFLAYGTPATATTAAVETAYKATKLTSAWADLSGNSKSIVPGIFVGYSKNSGSDPNAMAAYGRGIGLSGRGGISDLVRIAPRLEFISGKFRIGTEVEITSAAYGTSLTDSNVTASEIITNTRFLLTTTYSF
jgi:hypothetical protein